MSDPALDKTLEEVAQDAWAKSLDARLAAFQPKIPDVDTALLIQHLRDFFDAYGWGS